MWIKIHLQCSEGINKSPTGCKIVGEDSLNCKEKKEKEIGLEK